MTSSLLQILRCPGCAAAGKGVLRRDGPQALTCDDCDATFPVRDGLPFLITPKGDFLNVLEEGEDGHV